MPVLCSVLGGHHDEKKQSLSSGWGASMSRHSRVRGCEQGTGPWHVISGTFPGSFLNLPVVFFISLFFLLTFYWLLHLECKLQESRGHTWLIHHHILAPTTTLTDRGGPWQVGWGCESMSKWMNDQMLHNFTPSPRRRVLSKDVPKTAVWRRISTADMGNKEEATIPQHCPGWSMAPSSPPTFHRATAVCSLISLWLNVDGLRRSKSTDFKER